MQVLSTVLLAFASGTALARPASFEEALRRADDALLTAACSSLDAAVSDRVFSISSSQYASENSVNENWSLTNVQTPQCLFEPLSPQELAKGLQNLVQNNTKFAVRGGGHMPVPGSSSISDGVLVTSSGFPGIQLSSDRQTVSLGAGLRWSDVYTHLAQYDLVVPGGRFGHVGVPGLLLGGGINYFGNTVGWSMNSVVRYEVVLANGTILNATRTSAPDLFWALKGGSSNFGVITNFEMKTYPIGPIFGGLAVYDASQLDALVNASVAYLDNVHGGVTDLQTAIDPSIGLNPATKELTLFSVYFRNSSQDDPASLANFTSIPAIISTVGVRPNYATFVNDTLNPLINTDTFRRAFYSVGVQSNPQTARLIHETFWTAAQSSEINATLFYTFQPITTSWAGAAKSLGGDAIDLNPQSGNLMSLLFSGTWTDPSLDAAVLSFFREVGKSIVDAAQAQGQSYKFAYLNDAAGDEKPFSTYGGGKSLSKLKMIASKYDPSGVFQRLLPGGFKLC